MYLKFFNLKLKPFEISPDPQFLWVGEKHKEGLASLKYGILRGKGFMALTGDVGTGKTTLLNALAQSFDDKFIFARIPDPYLDELDFFNFTGSAFEMDKRFQGKGDFLTELSIFLNQAHEDRKEVILVVDEAQRITPEVLEDIRLISNIERPEKKLINILFSGQTNFNEILRNNEALRSRLAIYYKIEPLTELETEAYVSHRLKVAGTDRRIFRRSAIHEIYSLSNGNPRQINIISDLALLHAYSAESFEVDAGIVMECSKRALIPVPKSAPLAEYAGNQAIVPVNQHREVVPGWGLPVWNSGLTRIKAAVNRYKLAFLAPVPLIILICLIGILFYPDSFFSSVSKFRLQVKQAFNRSVAPVQDDASYQAQVVNVGTPTQPDSELEESIANLEKEKSRNQELTKEIAAQEALIADLRIKLEKADSEIAKLKKHLHINRQATALLKTQVKEADTQKASAETRLAGLQAAHNEMLVELEELKRLKPEVAKLEQTLTLKEGMLVQKDQELAELEKKLARLQNSETQLNSEMSAQSAKVDELQKGLAAAGEAEIALKNELQSRRREIEKLQTRLEEVDAQDTSSAEKLVKLQMENETLIVELERLKNAEAEVAELERELAEKERVLAQGNQRQQERNEAFSRSQKSNAELKTELSTQAASIAELQKKLETAQAGRAAGEESLQKELDATRAEKAALENSLQIARQETVLLQARVKDLETQMASSKSQFDYLRTAHTTLTADFEELKKTREQVADLKHEISIKDRIIEQKDQQREEWEQKLVRAQNSEEKLKGDLSKQATLAADLQQQLASARDGQIELKAQMEKNRQETAALRRQLNSLKTKQAPSTSSPSKYQNQTRSQSAAGFGKVEAEAPNPTDIIDFVIKKKSD